MGASGASRGITRQRQPNDVPLTQPSGIRVAPAFTGETDVVHPTHSTSARVQSAVTPGRREAEERLCVCRRVTALSVTGRPLPPGRARDRSGPGAIIRCVTVSRASW